MFAGGTERDQCHEMGNASHLTTYKTKNIKTSSILKTNILPDPAIRVVRKLFFLLSQLKCGNVLYL